jgi:D-3-phosphoglycerate dehydrogenase / 2-oxoglutarate reductase
MAAKVLISTSSFGKSGREPLERLEREGCAVTLNPHGRALTPDESKALLPGMDGIIAGTEKLDRGVLASAPTLKVLSRCGTGLDNVDLPAAKELGIRVTNTPEAHVDGVAELALAGILDVVRMVSAADRAVRAGKWHKPMGRLLRGKTVGIVGLGRVAKALVKLLEPFAVSILACDPEPDRSFARKHKIRYVELPQLLASSDVVTLHAPGGAGPLGREGIAQMKRGAILVNTARGKFLDEAALEEALRDGHLGGAYLDVFGTEPYRGPLAKLENVVLTPHIGAYAEECRLRMETEAADNLLTGLKEAGIL